MKAAAVVVSLLALASAAMASTRSCEQLIGDSRTASSTASLPTAVRGMFFGGVSLTLSDAFVPATPTSLSNSSCAAALCRCVGGTVTTPTNSSAGPSVSVVGCTVASLSSVCRTTSIDTVVSSCNARYSACVAKQLPASSPVLHGAMLTASTVASADGDDFAATDLVSGCVAASCYVDAAVHRSCAVAFNDTVADSFNTTCAAALARVVFRSQTRTKQLPPPPPAATPVPTRGIPSVTPANLLVITVPNDNATAAYKAWVDNVLQTYANALGLSAVQPVAGRTMPTRLFISVSSAPTEIAYTWLATFTAVTEGGTVSPATCANSVASAVNSALAAPAYAKPPTLAASGITTMSSISLNVLPFPILADTTVIGSDTQYPLWSLFLGVVIAGGFATCLGACLSRTLCRVQAAGSLSDRLGGITGEGLRPRNMSTVPNGAQYVEL